MAAYQQLASEKEALHRQLLLQTWLMDQLQQEEAQGKAVAKMACQKLQETQGRELLRTGLQEGQPGNLCTFSPSFLAP